MILNFMLLSGKKKNREFDLVKEFLFHYLK